MTKGHKTQLVCRIGIGCGSQESRAMVERYRGLGYAIVSADDIRSSKAKQGLPNFNVRKILFTSIMSELAKGSNVYVDSDHSTQLSQAIMTGVAAARGANLHYERLMQKEESLMRWISTASGDELSECLPWYFTHHPVLYSNHPAGPERGRRVAIVEIKRHLESWFVTGSDGYIVPSGKFF